MNEALGIGTGNERNMLKEMFDKDLTGKVGTGRLARYVVKSRKR